METFKNPFSIRASERIETDDTFLQLFSSEPLAYLEEKLVNNQLWGTLTYILSSPGAGKTTLLRLFSPSVLLRVTEKGHNAVYKKLQKLGVKEIDKLNKCAVYLQMGREYEFLEDDDLFGQREQRRIFLALLNARIVLASLKACMDLAKIRYNALDQITYTPDEPIPEFGKVKASYTGKELLDWAGEQERRVCEFLDNFVEPEGGIKGNNTLFALSAMKASWFTYKGKPLCDDFIFQIDDGHKLSERQKKIIRSEVTELRRNVTVWVAERLETLSTEEILGDNNIIERDFQVIRLENPKKGMFNTMARGIAGLRSGVSQDGIILFNSMASDSFESYTDVYNEASKKYLSQLSKLPNYDNFRDCAAHLSEEDPYERVINSRAMLMYASRQSEIGLRLFPYEITEMDGILNPLRPAAQEILPGEVNKLPQYYGVQTLIDLSSQNIEQFLNISSKMYEVLAAKKIMEPSNYVLTAEEQDQIVKKYCEDKLNDVKRLTRGNKIYDFLIQMITMCKEETFTPSYSYRTVSGFAVKEENSGRYIQDGFWFQEPAFGELATVIKDCLAYNLLDKVTTIQGKKDQRWTVFYLNRWLCAYAHLPLTYGGWRKLPLSKLNKWINPSKK